MAAKKVTVSKTSTRKAKRVARTESDATSPTPRSRDKPFPVVGIGASAGGLEAFRQLLEHLPTDTGMAFILVQHLDPAHESILTELLSKATPMPVSEVVEGVAVEPNHIYVIPRHANMAIAQGILRLLPREDTRGQRHPIDFFLRTLAEEQSNRAIGVILSGTASDGTLGLEAIKAEGGITFAQDEDSARYDGMPRSAIAAGCVDFVLPPDRIAEEIARIARHPYVAAIEVVKPDEEATAEEAPPGDEGFNQILQLLRKVAGADFSHYKPSTLRRRITRRLALHKIEGMDDYVGYLRDHREEVERLYQDILIRVTSFFRDQETFEVLKEKVFPELVRQRNDDGPLRFWVLGCSTGEEAYSIAIAFQEFAGDRAERVPIQIFATDLNNEAIEKARAGIYPQSMTNDVSPERLRRFFVKHNGGYQISKPIRDMCVFARQNALTDPPFSHIDLISCRNLLIYFEPILQKKIIPALHSALKPSGVLLLGSSETIGSFTDLFKLEDEKHKLYSKKPAPSRMQYVFRPGAYAMERVEAARKPVRAGGDVSSETDAQREADRILLQKYAPAGVLVDAAWEILQFRGSTSPYLEAPPGKATHNLLKMAREGLLAPLRTALRQAKNDDRPARREGLRVKFNGHSRDLNLEVVPVKGVTSSDRCFLVLFEPVAPGLKQKPIEASGGESQGARGTKRQAAEKQEIARLQQELLASREYLQSVIEQQEAYNEELQSANEEIQSSNEELQSINEELETAKEELQSSNEELTTINEELHNRNLEARQANNDLSNLLSSAQMPIIMLGNDLRIRRFTPVAERALNLAPADVGRPIADLKLNLDLPELRELLMEVIDTASAKDLEIQDQQGLWHILRLRPYRTLENKIDGAVIILVDIDQLKQVEEKLRWQNRLIETSIEPIYICNFDKDIVEWNQGCEHLYGYTRAEAVGRNNHELLRTIFTLPLEELNARLLAEGEWTGELRQMTKDGREVIVESRKTLTHVDGRRLVLITNRDITARKQAEERLRESEERFRTMADTSLLPIWVNDADAGCEFANKAYLDFFGKTLAELQGFGWRLHAHPNDEKRYIDSYLTAFKSRAPFRCQARFLNAEGEYRWLDSSGMPRFSESGEFLGYVGASFDVTETKLAELKTQFVNQLNLALWRSSDVDEMIRLTTNILGEYLDVSRCYVGEINSNAGLFVIGEDWEGWLHDPPSMVGDHSVADFVSPEFREEFENGRPVVVNDVTTDPRMRDIAANYEPFGIGAFISLPLLGETRWKATLSVNHQQARNWRPEELQLMREAASRLGTAVRRARAAAALRESEERVRTLVEQMIAGVAECDTTGKFVLVNQRYCDIVGYTKAELLEMRIQDIMRPDDMLRNAEFHRRLIEAGEPFVIEKRYRRKDGSEVWVNSNVSPTRNAMGVIDGVVAVVIDITDRKRAECEREQLLEQAQAANQSKDEFLTVISHELRSPLNSILGYARMLRAGIGDAEQAKQTVEIIERNGRIQLQMIEDLLDSARIISGKLELEVRPVALDSVITAALDVMRPAAEAKSVELISALDPLVGQIVGDPDRLQQVTWNLLSNAIKFTPEGGRIELRTQRIDQSVHITVSDNGKGIEPDFLPYVFDRFRQSDSSSARRFGGLGLGLSLVKRLVELHGGTVEAASEGLGRGATFTVALPQRAAQIETLIPQQPRAVAVPEVRTEDRIPLDRAPSLAGAHILVVDDLEEARGLLMAVLEECGAQVTAVSSGVEALAILADPPDGRRPDVLILDIAMPDEDGYKVLERVRSLEAERGVATSAQIPAIALTAYGRSEDRLRALTAGFRMHVSKPVEPAELAIVISSLVVQKA
ncbi:MAG TPA: PAS domain S-box protein [Blastocatellia bacterium]|nr:PAS domain S-box protein [Blastocatellia bacterium]